MQWIRLQSGPEVNSDSINLYEAVDRAYLPSYYLKDLRHGPLQWFMPKPRW